MAHAILGGKRHEIRVVQDLGENWSLEIYVTPDPKKEKTAEPFKPWPTPLCLKLRADTREDALQSGLQHLQKLGKIESFHLEPNEIPKPAAPKKAAAATDEDEEAAEEA
jgi:hypothetical protein